MFNFLDSSTKLIVRRREALPVIELKSTRIEKSPVVSFLVAAVPQMTASAAVPFCDKQLETGFTVNTTRLPILQSSWILVKSSAVYPNGIQHFVGELSVR